MGLLFQKTPLGLLSDEDAATIGTHFDSAPEEDKPYYAAKLNEYRNFREHFPRPLSGEERKAAMDERQRVESIFTDFEAATKDTPLPTLQFAEGPEREARKQGLANRAFLRHLMPGADSATAERDYELQRDALADRLFNGRGKGDDSTFHVEAKGWLERQKFNREVGASIAQAAAQAALWEDSGLPPSQRKDFRQWQEEAQKLPGYDMFSAAKYEADYLAAVTKARESFAPLKPEIDAAWLVLTGAGGQGEEPSMPDYIGVANRLAALTRNESRAVLGALSQRAQLLPEAEREGFFSRAAETADRQLVRLLHAGPLSAALGIVAGIGGDSEDVRRYKGILDDLRNLRELKIAPVPEGGWVDRAGLALAGSIPGVVGAAALSPWIFAGQFEDEAFDSIRTNSIAAGLDEATAEKWAGRLAPTAGVLMAAIEKATFGIAKGPLGGLQRSIIKRMAESSLAKRAVAGLAVEATEQWGQEVIQQAIPAIVQDAADALGAPVPDAEVIRQLTETASDPATLAVSLVFALGGMGSMPSVQRAAEAKRAGFTPEATDKLVSASTPEAIQQAWQEGLKTRKPQDPKALAEEMHEAAEDQQRSFTEAGVASVQRTPEGWEVVSNDGTRTRVESADAARVLVDDLRMVRAQEEADAMIEMAETFAEGDKTTGRESTQVFTGDVVKTTEGGMTAAKPGRAARVIEFDPASLSNLHEEIALLPAEQRATGAIVLGENEFQLRERIAGDATELVEALTTRQNIGATVLTQVHERAEAILRAGMAAGTITETEARMFVDDAAQIFDPFKARNSEAREFAERVQRVARGEGTATELRETVSELVVADVLGRRKDGGRLPAGAITRGVDEAIRRATDKAEKRVLGKFRAYLRAVRAYFKALFQTAATISKARREGKISKGDDFDNFVMKLLGLDGQAAHNQAVANLVVESAPSYQVEKGERAFSLASADYLERLAPQLAAKGRPPKERRAMYQRAQEQVAGMARAMRSNDENAGTSASQAAVFAVQTQRVRDKWREALAKKANERDFDTGAAKEEGWDADRVRAMRAQYATEIEKLRHDRDVELGKLAKQQQKDAANVTTAIDRREQLRALATLDSILIQFPAEVRGRVGGFYTVAKATTNAAREKVLRERIEKLDKVLEAHLRKEYTSDLKQIFERAEPTKGKAGEKPKGKAGAEVHDLFNVLRAAQDWDAATVDGHVAGLEASIASGNLTPEAEASKQLEAELVALVGDWRNADAARMAAAVEAVDSTLAGGLLAWTARKIIEREARAAAREALKADTGRAGTLAERTAEAERESGISGWLRKKWLSLSSFEEVARYVFGKDSTEARRLVDIEREASNQKEDETQAMGDDLSDLFTRLAGSPFKGEELRWQLAQRTLDGAVAGKMSPLEVVQATMMWRQPDGERHMIGKLDENGKPIGAWHYDQAWVDSIEAQLDDNAKAVRDYISNDYAGEWEVLNPLYQDRHGVSLPRNPQYSPLTVAPQQAQTGQMVDPVSGSLITGSALTPGSLRTRSRVAIAEPNFRDALQVFIAHKKQMAHWKAYGAVAPEMSALLGNREVGNSVEAKAGEQAKAVLRGWVDHFTQGGTRDAQAQLEINEGQNRMVQRATGAALIGRVSTLMIQSTQLAAAAVEMPTGAYLSRFGRLLSGNLGWRDAINSDYIQRRIEQMPPIVREGIRGLKSGKPSQLKHQVVRMGRLISGADALFTAGTYAILLDYHRKLGTEAGMHGAALDSYAHASAAAATDRVAQPTRPGQRSLYEVTTVNPMARAAWAFASEARQKIAMAGWAASEWRSNPKRLVKVGVLVWGVGGVAAQIIRNAWRDARDDDDDELFDEKNWSAKRMALASLAGPLQGIPVIGEMIEGAAAKAAGEYAPQGGLLGGLSDAAGAARSLVTGQAFDDSEPIETTVRRVESVLTGLAATNDTIAAAASVSHVVTDAFRIVDALRDDDEEAGAKQLKREADAKKEAKEAAMSPEAEDQKQAAAKAKKAAEVQAAAERARGQK